MSKLNVNKSIITFLKSNSVRICAVAMLTLSPLFLASCKNKNNTTNNNSIVSETQDNKFDNLKNYIYKNIDNIEVVENEEINGYYIYENLYSKEPIYDINKNGEKYIKSYEQNFIGCDQYFISYEEANELGISELLESKAIKYFKTK